MGNLQVKIIILLTKLTEKDFKIITNMEENSLALN